MFVGRKKELELLEKFYNDNSKKVACITGQAGMGKTTLLQEFAKDKKHIFHIAYPTTEAGQMILFARSISKAYELTGYDNTANLSTLRSQCEKVPTFSELMDTIATKTGDEKLLLIIDEYYNFIKADSTYEKTLHEYFTEKWTDKNIKLILCGDSFLAMDKFVLGKKAVWKDTDVESIQIGAMGFYESCEFFPDKSAEDRTFYFGLTGGIPAHLAKVSGEEQS